MILLATPLMAGVAGAIEKAVALDEALLLFASAATVAVAV
jgi:hypothetical protein